jgi:hypothetical protein
MGFFTAHRTAAADAEAERGTGMMPVLCGLITMYASAYVLAGMLGDQLPWRAEGGFGDLGNVAFFVVLELLLGAAGALVTASMGGAAAVVRLAIVVALLGAMVAYLAVGVPRSESVEQLGAAGLLMATLLRVAAIICIARLSRLRAA